jgi:hypothetical protein
MGITLILMIGAVVAETSQAAVVRVVVWFMF